MKKTFYMVLGILLTVSLSACDNGSNKASSKRENKTSAILKKKKEVTKKKTENINTKMNFDQIMNGNFSSLKGTWHLSATEQKGTINFASDQGAPIQITGDTIVTDAISLNKQGLKDTNGVHPIVFKEDKGSLVTNLKDEDSVSINWSVTFYPAGTTDTYIDTNDKGTNSKNTIVIWTSNNNFSEVFVQDSATK
ncbi:DUF6287 domain-containing protein [Lactobacillus sp. YT155]|uniref:DUF6287 domain-containing protein n=1 Tax=Lactobacillus sp. YT155 TaxID=3060955 RepID=UPI00265E98EF|nr:DUF6287 domain-containing protein [Lactobacillus sp. YT155]MDO1605913.1 DUF6287 domain-containing protein [Lactobacillus sp. YT155]